MIRVAPRFRLSPASLLVVLLLGALAPALQGCGGGCSALPPASIVCVTQGDRSTAYLSSTVTEQTCPAGWRCVNVADKTPQNAALLRSCGVATPVVTTPVTGPGGALPAGPLPAGPLQPGPRPVLPGATPRMAVVPALPAPAAPPVLASCLSQCPVGSKNPSCVSFALTPAQNAVAAQLATWVVQERRPQIEAPLFMRMFRVAADPCQRGPLHQSGGRVSNTGGRCLITTELPSIQAIARIELPASLEATAAVGNPAAGLPGNVYRFSDPASRPSIHLLETAHPGIAHRDDAHLGGAILQMEADPSRLFMRTSSACIGATYSASPTAN